MIKAYVEFWKRYVDFEGKSSVAKFWLVVLCEIIISAIFYAITFFASEFSIISAIYGLAALIPSIALLVRRLRDGKNHWANIFWILLPLIGWVILVIKLVKPSC